MYPRALLWAFLTLPLLAQQRIVVSNAATPSFTGLGFRVAPRSLIQIVSTDEGNRSPYWFDREGKVEVTLRPEGSESVPAKVLHLVNSNILLAQVPEGVPPGNAEIRVHVSGEASAPAYGTIARSSFRLFSIAGGSGPARAQNVRDGVAETNGLAHPARPGDYIAVWGTGLGDAPVSSVHATLGGQELEVAYAGPAAGGLEQINLRIPESAQIGSRCYAPLSITIAGEASNAVTLTTGTGPACPHPLSLTEEQMRQLDAGRSVEFGFFAVDSRLVPPFPDESRRSWVTRIDSAHAGMTRIHAPTAWLFAQSLSDELGTCKVTELGVGSAQGTVTTEVVAATNSGTMLSDARPMVAHCIAEARTGEFHIPTEVLSKLPAGQTAVLVITAGMPPSP